MSTVNRGTRTRARNNATKESEVVSVGEPVETPLQIDTTMMDVDPGEPSMQLLAEAAQNSARAPELNDFKDDEDDSRSSSLSEIDEHGATEGSEQPENDSVALSEDEDEDEEDEDEEEEDTEAETERLEPSPDKTRKRRRVLLNSVLEDNASSVAALDEDAETADAADGKADDADSNITSPAESADVTDREPSSSRKRKRAEDETATSLKKVSLELANHVADQIKAADDNGTPEPSGPGNDEPAMDVDEVSGDESQAEEQAETNGNGDEDVVEAAESNLEDADIDEAAQELDAANSARTEEELRNKKAALEKLSDIEKDFALLRDKLFADRNAQLTNELAMIQSDAPTHPEYLAIVEAIDQLRNERIEHAKTVYGYKLQSLQRKAVTTRAVMQSQYMQRVRELREDTLERASAEWYQIQRERRNFDADKEAPLRHFGGNRAQWVAAQTAYNTEVSILSGMAKYVGFPAAPEIKGATTAEVDEDLRKMGISRQSTVPPVAVATIPSVTRPKPGAEEQFIAETAWANPQHSQSQYLTNVHRQAFASQPGMQPPSSPPAGAAATASTDLPAGNTTASVSAGATTPAAQKRTTDPVTAPNGSASTIPVLPSSEMKGPTPMVVDPTAPDRAEVVDATPSKVPEMKKAGRESGAEEVSRTTDVQMTDGAVGPAAAVGSGGGTKVASSPPGQQALQEAVPPMEQPASLPPRVQVGSI